MSKQDQAMFRATQLDRFMETGITSIRRTLKRGATKIRPLQLLPVNLFAAVMGIAGLSLAWRQAGNLFQVNPAIATYIGVIAIVVFIVLTIAYVSKWVLFPRNVKEEFFNPVVGNFFGTISISILLLSAVIRPYYPIAGQWIWAVGMALALVLSYVIVQRLMNNRQDLLHATPAWLIPGVGTLDVAVTSAGMPFEWHTEINLLTFAIGSVLALVFFTLIFSRLMHHDPMPQRLTPSLIILIAPFAVGFLAYTNVTGTIDLFASILFYFGLFLFTILFFKVFNRKLPFMITWWAVGFPIAALTNASLKYAAHVNTPGLRTVAATLLAILTLLIATMLLRSVIQLLQGKLL